MPEVITFKPQAGPQTEFLASDADIVIYGGAAGGGKSYGVLLEPIWYALNIPDYQCLILRRSMPEVTRQGGLWDESQKIYSFIKEAKPIGLPICEWRFQNKSKIKFGHLQYEKTVYDYKGAQIPAIIFDELTSFTQFQFIYLLSRNRSVCGIKPYIKATTNPDAESWVRNLIDWWIDNNGYAIKERSGIIRWLVIKDNCFLWGSTREECIDLHGNKDLSYDDENQIKPRSFTFIHADLSDNKELTSKDPNYRANLEMQNPIERERLLRGNWNIKYTESSFLQLELLLNENKEPLPIPSNCDYVIAVMDTAQKAEKQNDATAVIYCAITNYPNKTMVVLDYDMFRIQSNFLESKMPAILNKLKEWHIQCNTRGGMALYVPDTDSGIALLQNVNNRNQEWHFYTEKIPNSFVRMGKNAGAIQASPYVWNNQIKLSEYAYNKTIQYDYFGEPNNTPPRNHLIYQITRFRYGVDNKFDDLFDVFREAIQIAFVNQQEIIE
jgi:hypothetical protein